MKPLIPLLMLLSALPAWGKSQLTWADKNVHYARNSDMPALRADTTITAWRGERITALALLKPDSDGMAKAVLAGRFNGEAQFVNYVLTDDFRACGKHPDDLTPWEVPDRIGGHLTQVKAGELQPIWVNVEVPRNAKTGITKRTLVVDGERITLNVNVIDREIPVPEKWNFYLNLWQQPYAVARFYNVEPWSVEHFRLLQPYAQMLARAGQRTISTILFHEPWGEQSNDTFLPMVQTIKRKDGTWAYDYSIFDQWVEFMTEYGVGPDIECFTMIPWEMKFRYYDEAQKDFVDLQTTTDSAEYKELWGNSLSDFWKHLEEKKWQNRAVIAMDERSMGDMLNAISVIEESAPGLRISLAGNYHPEFADKIYSLSITQGDMFPPGEVTRRRHNGQVSSLYTCCTSPEPNLFSNNQSADAAWLPIHCYAVGSDGYLHWSWMNWTDKPMADTRFKLFAPGDTYFVYPEGEWSVRFERLLEGIQITEKLRQLREESSSEALREIDDALSFIAQGRVRKNASTAQQVNYMNQIIARYEQTSKQSK